MAMQVIHRFEAIEVDRDERDRLLFCPFEGSRNFDLRFAAIAQPGQRVMQGHLAGFRLRHLPAPEFRAGLVQPAFGIDHQPDWQQHHRGHDLIEFPALMLMRQVNDVFERFQMDREQKNCTEEDDDPAGIKKWAGSPERHICAFVLGIIVHMPPPEWRPDKSYDVPKTIGF